MFATRRTIINWMKMNEVRDCLRFIDGKKCVVVKSRALYSKDGRMSFDGIL